MRDQEQQLKYDSVPKDLHRGWEDPMAPDRYLAQELRNMGSATGALTADSTYEMPEWKKVLCFSSPLFFLLFLFGWMLVGWLVAFCSCLCYVLGFCALCCGRDVCFSFSSVSSCFRPQNNRNKPGTQFNPIQYNAMHYCTGKFWQERVVWQAHAWQHQGAARVSANLPDAVAVPQVSGHEQHADRDRRDRMRQNHPDDPIPV